MYSMLETRVQETEERDRQRSQVGVQHAGDQGPGDRGEGQAEVTGRCTAC